MAFLKDELSGFVPTEVADNIVKKVVRGSSALRLGKTVEMNSEEMSCPVMTDGVSAYWVGEGKRIHTSKPTWITPKLKAKKLAIIIPVTKEKLQDSTIDVMEELEDSIAEAFYCALDAAAFFGINSPFEKNIFDVAVAGENVIVAGTNRTLDMDASDAMSLVEDAGFDVNGFAAHYGIKNSLRKLRDANGNTLFVPGTDTSNFFNEPIEFSRNGAWDKKKAEMITGDWEKLLCGVRSGIEYEILKEATLMDTLDEDGKPISLAEQDLVAVKATMRVGLLQLLDDAFAVVIPESADDGVSKTAGTGDHIEGGSK